MEPEHVGEASEYVHFSYEAFFSAMALVRSGADASVNQGLRQLRVMSDQTGAPLKDVSAAATEADAMPVLLRILNVFPPESDAVKSVVCLLVNLAVEPVGCELLMAANVLSALGVCLQTTESIPVDVIDNACWLLSNLAGESLEIKTKIVESGAFHGILMPSLRLFFAGEVRDLAQIYGTLAWTLANFCSGRLPYAVLKPLMPYIAWALEHLSNQPLSEVTWAVANLFDEARADIEWSDVTDPQTGMLRLILRVLAHPQCRGANPASLVRVVNNVSALGDTMSVFTPSLVATLTDLLEHQAIVRNSAALAYLLSALSNVAAEQEGVSMILAHPGALPSIMAHTYYSLQRLSPRHRPDKAVSVWKATLALAQLLVNLVDGSGNVYADSAHALDYWAAPRWAACVLRAVFPRCSPKAVSAAVGAKQATARLSTLLIRRGSLTPHKAYAKGEAGPNVFFSYLAAAEGLRFVISAERLRDAESTENGLLTLAATLACPGAVRVKADHLRKDMGDDSYDSDDSDESDQGGQVDDDDDGGDDDGGDNDGDGGAGDNDNE